MINTCQPCITFIMVMQYKYLLSIFPSTKASSVSPTWQDNENFRKVRSRLYIHFYFMANIFTIRDNPSGYFNIFSIRPVFAFSLFNCSFILCAFLSDHLVNTSLACLPRFVSAVTRPRLSLLSLPPPVYLPHMSKYTKFIHHC